MNAKLQNFRVNQAAHARRLRAKKPSKEQVAAALALLTPPNDATYQGLIGKIDVDRLVRFKKGTHD
jgi:hypothetical protein